MTSNRRVSLVTNSDGAVSCPHVLQSNSPQSSRLASVLSAKPHTDGNQDTTTRYKDAMFDAYAEDVKPSARPITVK